MAKETKTQRIINALIARGSVEVPSNSYKYRTFTRPLHTTSKTFYFVGKAGGLRAGSCASKSFSCENLLPRLLAAPYEPKKEGK